MRAMQKISFIAFIACAISFAVYIFQTLSLFKRLREKHPEEYEYLTTIWGLGPGLSNPLRFLPFIFSREDFGDKEIMRLKQLYKRYILYTVLSFIVGLVFA